MTSGTISESFFLDLKYPCESNLYFNLFAINGVNGSGMHVHQSIMSVDEETNFFYDEKTKYGLSEMAMHYLAGVLTHGFFPSLWPM